MLQLFAIVIVIGLPSLVVYLCYKTVKKLGRPTGTLVLANVFSLILFFISLSNNQSEFYERVLITDVNYTPFASPHALTLFTFLTLSFAALCLIWIRQNALPPLLLIMAMSLIIIGAIIHVGIIIHTLGVSENVIVPVVGESGVQHTIILCIFPLVYLVTAIIILTRLMKSEVDNAKNRSYQSALLNYLNKILAKRQYQPLWALLLALPVFLLIIMILVLFGQDSHAITKVFTETTTWHFSTKSHPPLLDPESGHYLCTVAAYGDERVVKPLGWGQRHGYPILVNRQLQIANAFEELIQDKAPKLHMYIRGWYDKYGYPLSVKITSAKKSNLTYRLMKPLEYFFLLTLYVCCLNPEQKISRQYQAASKN